MSDAQAIQSPFHVYTSDEREQFESRTDAIFVETSQDDDRLCFELPQFGIEISVPFTTDPTDAGAEAAREIVKRILSFYAALIELPDEYVTDVETLQKQIIAEHLLPWWAHVVGRNPAHVSLPSGVVVIDGQRLVSH